MTTLVTALRRRNRDPGHRDERGFALLVVIAAIGFFSVVVIALLGMLLTDMKVQALARDVDVSKRAVDGALDVAVNQLRKDASLGRLTASGNEPCDPLGAIPITIEQVAVLVSCSPMTGDQSRVLPTSKGPSLLLLGGYNWLLDDLVESANAAGGTFGTAIAGGAQTLSNQIGSQGFGLIHFGQNPLLVDGDVRVKQSTVAQRRNAVNTPVSPAMRIDGKFNQGQVGLFGNLALVLFGITIWSSPSCGVMDPSLPTDIGTKIIASQGMGCGPGYAPWTEPPPPSFAGLWSTKSPVTIPTGGCSTLDNGHGVVVMPVGYYGPAQTQILNTWFGDRTTCTGKTFWFPPGNYYFDVTSGTGLSRNALRMADPASNWVFGAPTQSWDPATGRAPSSAFPAACDPAKAGVTVTLSARTSLRHEAGLAAMCGIDDVANPGARLMLYQEALGSTVTWAGTPTAATSTSAPAFLTPPAATASTSPVPVDYPAYGSTYQTTENATALSSKVSCGNNVAACAPTIRFTGSANPDAPAPSGSITGLKLRIRATTTNVNDYANLGNLCLGTPCSYLDLTITATDGTVCRVSTSVTEPTSGLPHSTSTYKTYDLSSCAAQGFADATKLDGATVDIKPQLKANQAIGNCGYVNFVWTCPSATLSIDYLWLQSTTNAPSSPSAFSTIVDTSAGNAIYFFGPVQIPRAEVEVNWWTPGPQPATLGIWDATPIFGNGLVAKSLASWTETGDRLVGMLASPAVQRSRRKVLVRAVVGGRLRGSAIVTINDGKVDLSGLSTGRQLAVNDWRLCNEPLDAERDAVPRALNDVGCSP